MVVVSPWVFWTHLLGNAVLGSLVGTTGILAICALMYLCLPNTYNLCAILLFLIWVGPVILYQPFALVFFVIPSALRGDWDLPIGCARDPEHPGKFICV